MDDELRELMSRYRELRAACDAGSLSREEFLRILGEAAIPDSENPGCWWNVDPGSGNWVYFDGKAWRRRSPETPEARPSPRSAGGARPAPPAEVTTTAGDGIRAWLVALVILLLAAVVVAGAVVIRLLLEPASEPRAAGRGRRDAAGERSLEVLGLIPAGDYNLMRAYSPADKYFSPLYRRLSEEVAALAGARAADDAVAAGIGTRLDRYRLALYLVSQSEEENLVYHQGRVDESDLLDYCSERLGWGEMAEASEADQSYRADAEGNAFLLAADGVLIGRSETIVAAIGVTEDGDERGRGLNDDEAFGAALALADTDATEFLVLWGSQIDETRAALRLLLASEWPDAESALSAVASMQALAYSVYWREDLRIGVEIKVLLGEEEAAAALASFLEQEMEWIVLRFGADVLGHFLEIGDDAPAPSDVGRMAGNVTVSRQERTVAIGFGLTWRELSRLYGFEREFQPGAATAGEIPAEIPAEDSEAEGPPAFRGTDCSGAINISVETPVSGSVRGTAPLYYRFVAAASGPYRIYTSGNTDTLGALLDGDCLLLEEDDDSGSGSNFSIERELAAGTYHVQVWGFGSGTSGPFELRVEMLDPTRPRPDGGGVDESVDESIDESVEEVRIGAPASGFLRGRTPILYRFSIAVSGHYAIYTESNTDTRGALLDSDRRPLDDDDDGGERLNFRIERTLLPGTYYVNVWGFSEGTSGPFSLVVEEVAVDSGGGGSGGCSGAGRVEVGSSTIHSLGGTNREIFRFEVAEPDAYTITTSGLLDTVGELLDSNCSTIAINDDGGQRTNFLISRRLNPDTYYVSVRGYSPSQRGQYVLLIFRGEGEGSAGVGGCAGALAVEIGRPVEGILNGTGQLFYRFEVSYGGRYQIYTTGDIDLVGTLYDERCQAIATDDDSGQDYNFRITTRDLEPGTYYVSVRPYNRDAFGPFTLHIEAEGTVIAQL